eukprot:87802_1
MLVFSDFCIKVATSVNMNHRKRQSTNSFQYHEHESPQATINKFLPIHFKQPFKCNPNWFPLGILMVILIIIIIYEFVFKEEVNNLSKTENIEISNNVTSLLPCRHETFLKYNDNQTVLNKICLLNIQTNRINWPYNQRNSNITYHSFLLTFIINKKLGEGGHGIAFSTTIINHLNHNNGTEIGKNYTTKIGNCYHTQTEYEYMEMFKPAKSTYGLMPYYLPIPYLPIINWTLNGHEKCILITYEIRKPVTISNAYKNDLFDEIKALKKWNLVSFINKCFFNDLWIALERIHTFHIFHLDFTTNNIIVSKNRYEIYE